MNKMNKDDVRKQAMEIFRRTRKEIDPMVLLRTKQIIEKNSEGNVLDAFVKKGDAINLTTNSHHDAAAASEQVSLSTKADIPVNRTKMCKIVMEYLALRPKQDDISDALSAAINTANKSGK